MGSWLETCVSVKFCLHETPKIECGIPISDAILKNRDRLGVGALSMG